MYRAEESADASMPRLPRNEARSVRQLTRVVRSPEGQVSLDARGKSARTRRLCVPQRGMPEESNALARH